MNKITEMSPGTKLNNAVIYAVGFLSATLTVVFESQNVLLNRPCNGPPFY